LWLIETKDWVWFEEGLAYDNARLPQALILTGIAMGEPTYIEAGLKTLRWLMTLQTSAAGCFRPVGSDSFGDKRRPPRPVDQQPLEAAATISACAAAWRADGDIAWTTAATRAFAWFLGHNDLNIPLVDVETGSCRDGLHPDRANENRGGESVVCYLLGLAEIRQLAHMREGLTERTRMTALSTATDGSFVQPIRGPIVPGPIPEPPGALFATRSIESARAAVPSGDRTKISEQGRQASG
jgi:hypothetical protein